jgi:spore coat polysaccharide biosynthesis predicted glycosyltransferase SpsG
MRIVFRADAGAEIGTGHIMRCLALAQAWHDAGGSSIFASVTCPPGLADRLRCEGSALETIAAEPGSGEDAEQTARVAAREAADWLVLDGYRFDDAFEDSIRTGGARVCAFDDYGHALHSAADLIVNQNEYARAEEYGGRGASDRLLLGSRYAALRREFRRYRDWRRDDPQTSASAAPTPTTRPPRSSRHSMTWTSPGSRPGSSRERATITTRICARSRVGSRRTWRSRATSETSPS